MVIPKRGNFFSTVNRTFIEYDIDFTYLLAVILQKILAILTKHR